MMSKLSIIIVEYHSINEIINCVISCHTHIKVSHEIIVSSNSCYDKQQQEEIKKNNTNIRWLFNERNGGFAYAMNKGMKEAKGDYLTIMNSDCILASNLDSMINFMDKHPEIGAIAPQMKDVDGNIQDTARSYVSVPRYILRQARRIVGRKTSILDTDINYNQIQTVDWLIGAFIMVSRKAYEKTGGLDEQFFMYAEDLDWCTRIRQQNLEIVYFPKVIVIYKGSRRARSNSKYAKIFIQSHIKYWHKFGFFYGYPKRQRLQFTI